MNEQNDIEGISNDFTQDSEYTQKTNPWAKPISYIAWGFLLTLFTLNFLMLQYILPTIGAILMYLGFRSLRNINRWFFTAWIIASIKLFLYYVQLIIFTTPIFIYYQNNISISVIFIILQVILLFVFRNALQTIYRQTNTTPTRDPILWAIIWTGLMVLCAIYSLTISWIIIIPLLIFLIRIIQSLYKLGDELSDVSHIFVYAPVKVSNVILILRDHKNIKTVRFPELFYLHIFI